MIEDTRRDPAFKDHPAAAASPGIGSFVGVPVLLADDTFYGTLCAVDPEPRSLAPGQVDLLVVLARLVATQIERDRAQAVAAAATADAEAARARLHDLFMQAPALIGVLRGREGVVELFNPRFQQLWGNRDVLGKTMREAWPELAGQGYYELVERVYDGGKPVFGDEVPARIDRHNDGGLDEAFFTFVYHPTRDVAGRVDGVMIFGVEVTEQVRARRQVEELAGAAETRAAELEATLEALADGVILYDAEAGKRRDNRALRAILGLDADPAYDALPFAVRRDRLDIRDAAGRPVSPEALPPARALRGETLTGPAAMDLRMLTLDGRAIEVEVSAAPVRDATGAIVGAVGGYRDVTDRRRLERQAAAERDRLRQVVDALPEAVVICDAAGRFVLSNRAVVDLLGVDPIGLPVPLAEGASYEEFGARRLDGSPFPSSELPLQRSFLTGETVLGEQVLFRHAGTGRDVPCLVNSVPLLDGTGAPAGALAVFQDITPLVELERARDDFLVAIAHDLKNPLATIRGLAQLSQRLVERLQVPERARLAGRLTGIVRATTRATALLDEQLDVARVRTGEPLALDQRPVDLVALARRVTAEQAQATTRHRLRLDTDLTDLVAAVDEARLERVVVNLLSNAVKYSPDGGDVRLSLARAEEEGRAWAVLAVADEGVGIPAADLPLIGERFRRASNVTGRIAGTGIGLASVRQIVDAHGGRLAIASREGVGSTFTVQLPLEPAPPPPAYEPLAGDG